MVGQNSQQRQFVWEPLYYTLAIRKKVNFVRSAYLLALVSLIFQLIINGIALLALTSPFIPFSFLYSFGFFAFQSLGFILMDFSGILVGIFFSNGFKKSPYKTPLKLFKYIGTLLIFLFGLSILSTSSSFLFLRSVVFLNEGFLYRYYFLLRIIWIFVSLLILFLFRKILNSLYFSGTTRICKNGMLFFGLAAMVNGFFLTTDLLRIPIIPYPWVFAVGIAISIGATTIWFYFAKAIRDSEFEYDFRGIGFEEKYMGESFDL